MIVGFTVASRLKSKITIMAGARGNLLVMMILELSSLKHYAQDQDRNDPPN
jgi:hypothetical protein